MGDYRKAVPVPWLTNKNNALTFGKSLTQISDTIKFLTIGLLCTTPNKGMCLKNRENIFTAMVFAIVQISTFVRTYF